MARENKLSEKGSVGWFDASRRRCVDHLRALLSIKMARASMLDLLSGWDSQPPTVKCALHSACVISYGRTFVHSETNTGKITYPTRQLMKASGFDIELHKHILDLRNRIIAHGDYGVFPSTMYLQSIGDERLPIVLGINVKSIFGISERSLADRYQTHLSACEFKLEELLNLECNELAIEAKLHPELFASSHNIPEVHELPLLIDSDLADIPRPSGPAGRVKDPSLPDGLSAYRYITLTHQIALQSSGKHLVINSGVQSEIELLSE
jgi:hypothetical protein